jgi:hypothetical protein
MYKWDIQKKAWTFISGSQSISTPGVYGTLGVPSSLTVPGGRFGSSVWQSGSKLYLFGGYGIDSSKVIGNNQFILAF